MPRKKPLNAIGHFSLSRDGAGELNESRFALLEKIRETGSITKAAKAVGISYRTAWLTVDHLNGLDSGPMVERTTGGKSGGGTVLTDNGARIVGMYRIMRKEHGDYMQRLRDGMHDFDRFLRLTRKISLKTSVRNQLFGTIKSIEKDALSALVVVSLKGGARISSRITADGLDGLGVRVGDEVYVLIKANWVELLPGPKPAASRKPAPAKRKGAQVNSLQGTLISLRESPGNPEFALRLSGGLELVASVRHRGERSGFVSGEPATARFDASNVILGVPY